MVYTYQFFPQPAQEVTMNKEIPIQSLYEDGVCGNCGSPLDEQGRCKSTEGFPCGTLNLPARVNAVLMSQAVTMLQSEAYIFQPIF
jgi:hypothetical protein